MSGRPLEWPIGQFSEALAEGIFQLAGKLYKATGKHLLKQVVLDAGDLVTHGIPPAGCEIATSVGKVKIVGLASSGLSSGFEDIARARITNDAPQAQPRLRCSCRAHVPGTIPTLCPACRADSLVPF